MIPSKGENTKQLEFWVTAQHGFSRHAGRAHATLDGVRCWTEQGAE